MEEAVNIKDKFGVTPFKSRTLCPSRPVEVYRNLHAKDPGRCWSIKQGGLVVGHAGNLGLDFVTAKISQAGRLRVRREQRKNVHARLVGTVREAPGFYYGSHISYNPYAGTDDEAGAFRFQDGSPYHGGGRCLLRADGKVLVLNAGTASEKEH